MMEPMSVQSYHIQVERKRKIGMAGSWNTGIVAGSVCRFQASARLSRLSVTEDHLLSLMCGALCCDCWATPDCLKDLLVIPHTSHYETNLLFFVFLTAISCLHRWTSTIQVVLFITLYSIVDMN